MTVPLILPKHKGQLWHGGLWAPQRFLTSLFEFLLLNFYLKTFPLRYYIYLGCKS